MQELRDRAQQYGVKTLSAEELLACLLMTDTAGRDPLIQARELLETYGIRHIRHAEFAELCADGLTTHQALSLQVTCELAQRFNQADMSARVRITSLEEAYLLLNPAMMHLEQETMRVLALDTQGYVIANVQLYIGTVNESSLRVAEVFRPAVVRNSPYIIVAHNHPSGDPTPSEEDTAITRQLIEVGKLLGIDLLDHIIIGNPRWTSLRLLMHWSEDTPLSTKGEHTHVSSCICR